MVYHKECVVCGKPFEAKNNRYLTCSKLCHEIHYKEYRKEYSEWYYTTPRGMQKRKEHYTRRVHTCVLCNSELPDGRQKKCLSCLIKGYLFDKNICAYRALYQRGFTKEDIVDEAYSLGILPIMV